MTTDPETPKNMVQTLSYDPITWLPGQPQECAPRGGGNPQNFWVGGTPLRYIGESWCVWAAEKLMFGHCIAHGFGLFSSHLGVRPGSQLRPACGRLVGHGRPCCVPSSRGLAAAGHGVFLAGQAWLWPARVWLRAPWFGCSWLRPFWRGCQWLAQRLPLIGRI